MQELVFQDDQYIIERYPKTNNTSLQAWSNAELLALDYIKDKPNKKIHIYNDRFGTWNCCLNDRQIITISTYASQQKAISHNLSNNNLNTKTEYKNPLEKLKRVELALLKIPKSIELFELFLQQLHKAATENTEIICCFMTKYFSPSILEIASIYFEVKKQSKAWKKARLLILTRPKNIIKYKELINSIGFKNNILKQYYGVFSSSKIDIGTQFFLENFKLQSNEKTLLDLASGNGIIAHSIISENPKISACLVDDFNLAIESSKINLKNFNATYIHDNSLENFKKNSFDIVVSNPPFHFEYETNIEITLNLFEDVKRILKPNGRFSLVANKHLNYKTHLSKLFSQVDTVSENKKFVIYDCFVNKT